MSGLGEREREREHPCLLLCLLWKARVTGERKKSSLEIRGKGEPLTLSPLEPVIL